MSQTISKGKALTSHQGSSLVVTASGRQLEGRAFLRQCSQNKEFSQGSLFPTVQHQMTTANTQQG